MLLPAAAWAAGSEVSASVAALHGADLGAAAWAAVLSWPIRLGADPIVVARIALLVVGGAAAALSAHIAAAVAGGRGARWAALTTGALVAGAFPGWHFELLGLSGRTPESVPLQLGAIAILCGASTIRRALVAGFAVGAAFCLSPVALLCLAGLPFLLRAPSLRHFGSMLVALGSGFVAAPVAAALLVPGGWSLIAPWWEASWAAAEGGALGPGVLGLLTALPRALEGGAHAPDLLARRMILAVLALGMPLVWGWSAVRREIRALPGRLLAAMLPTVAALSVLPTDTWFYPLAYRYWMVALLLGLAVMGGVGVGAGGRRGALVLAAAAVTSVVALSPPGRQILAPPPSLQEALWNAAAHRLGPRSGLSRDEVAAQLLPGVPGGGRGAFLEGFGASLGADMAVDHRDGRADAWPEGSWWPGLQAEDGRSLRFGLGCGWTAIPLVPGSLVGTLGRWPLPSQRDVVQGLVCCGADRGRFQGSELAAIEPEILGAGGPLAEAWSEGLRCAAAAEAFDETGRTDHGGPLPLAPSGVVQPGRLVPPRP